MDSTNYKPSNIITESDKKIMRRDVERKRRQEMATLYASLRSNLPHETIKGKRSVVDHIDAAKNYILYLEKNIKELGLKRDRELIIKNNNSSSNTTSLHSGSGTCTCVTVYPILGGVKILLSNCGLDTQNFLLSRVLFSLLLEEEIDVLSCVSTKVDQLLLHTIHTEVRDLTSFNMSNLQRKLNEL